MTIRLSSLFLLLASFLCISCAHISKRMPHDLERMHEFLTQDDPGICKKYYYNFERQVPRLYNENKLDSILDVIEYYKDECGPVTNVEITRLLLLIEQGKYNDSLIGSATIPQMLWYRSEQEYMFDRKHWMLMYGRPQPIDNTHDGYSQFQTNLANDIKDNKGILPHGQVIGQFYSGDFDSALVRIQSDEFRGSKIQREYKDYVRHKKRMFPTRGHMAVHFGSWQPQGKNEILGNHPELSFQFGGEGKWWRADGTFGFRFAESTNKYSVDSLGQIVETQDFYSQYIGGEFGLKFIDNSILSTDIFVGLGYENINSIKKKTDPNVFKHHGTLSFNFGLRQRFFVSRSTGWYIGGIIRYNVVDYNNRGGSDLSGNTLSLSIVTGVSFHETLNQFLDKLNYNGSRRP